MIAPILMIPQAINTGALGIHIRIDRSKDSQLSWASANPT